MKTISLYLLLVHLLIAISIQSAQAANTPCSGNKGGIDHCDGAKFVCNDGSYSASTKDCAVVFGDNGTILSNSPISEPLISNTESIITSTGDIIKLVYEGFTVWLDCSKRGAIKFRYIAQRDVGSAKRYDKFMLDPKVPTECQQTSTNAYGLKYDRGHQVPANHLDASDNAIKQTNYMTNILPQAANMNRGAWYLTEEIVECYRDISELLVMGGVIWGNIRQMITLCNHMA